MAKCINERIFAYVTGRAPTLHNLSRVFTSVIIPFGGLL